jgi:hypothetical protein
MEKVRSKDGAAIAFDRFGDEPPVILVCGGSTAWQTHHWPRPWHCTSPSSTTAVGVTVAGGQCGVDCPRTWKDAG